MLAKQYTHVVHAGHTHNSLCTRVHVCNAGVISLIQKVLQLYAAKALAKTGSSSAAVDQVIQADEEDWEPLIRQLLQSDQTTEADFSQELQKRMEGTVLGQSSGSYKQRVQVSCRAVDTLS